MILEKYKKSSRADKNLIKVALLIIFIALMIATVFIVRAAIKSPESPQKKPVDFDATLGEASYLGVPVAYPIIDSSQMVGISIWKHDEESGKTELSFAMTREGMDVYKNQFVLSYTDSNGNVVDYRPDIIAADSYFDYSSLYSSATSGENAYAIPKITYITSALGVLYFDARISYTEENKATVLERYGFDEDSPVIIFTALDAEGKEIEHKIRIGKKLVTDSAYYFTVDDRPCVYATKTNYFDYALANFESFIHSTLISAGLEPDSSYEPILTPGYEQWTNSVYKYREDENGNREYYFVKDGDESATDKWYVGKNDKVIATARQILPYSKEPSKEELDALGAVFKDGYVLSKDGKRIEFDLGSTKDMREAKYVLSALLGKTAGDCDSFIATALGDFIPVEFPENMPLPAAQYFFTITHIESVFEEGVEKTVGTDTPNEAVKVTYTLSVNGTEGENPMHAILTLDRNLLPNVPGNDEKYDTLVNADVGELAEPIIIKDAYAAGARSGVICDVQLVMTDIVLIYDKNGYNIDKVANDSYVMYRYYVDYVYKYVVNGEDGEVVETELYRTRVESEKPDVIDMSKASEEEKKALVGKTLNLEGGSYSTRLSEAMIKCTPFISFSAYEISEIYSLVRSEKVVSFKFVDEIDPFFRESVYENTLDNEYGIYAINPQACEAVIHLLGGLGGNAGTSEGLSGLETVAVGITPDVMEKYGLYSKTIYFELPRLIYEKKTGAILGGADEEEEKKDEEKEETGFVGAFDYHEKLCFTLYISEKDELGYRYIGSELYDIVAKVNAEDFAFLDESFIDLWVRRNLVLVNVTDLSRVKIELNMKEIYGEYEFIFNHKKQSDATQTTTYAVANFAKPISASKLADYLKENGASYGRLDMNGDGVIDQVGGFLGEFYEDATGKYWNSKYETVGDSNFKTFLQTLYSTYYTEVLTPEEQAEYLDSCEPLMTMRFDLEANLSSKAHMFEFRRIDNGRVMVSYYTASDGVFSARVSDFCIPTFAFKKLVYTFSDLLNAEDLDSELPWGKVENQ